MAGLRGAVLNESNSVGIPSWMVAVGTPVFVAIATALVVLAFRSGAIVDGLENIGRQLGQHTSMLENHERRIGDNTTHIRTIEAIDIERLRLAH